MKELFIIPTPIGNLKDISPNITETLEKVEVIFCENTKVTGSLLKKLNIDKKRLISYNNFNETSRMSEIEEIFSFNDLIGLVSDAGAPTISDPGYTIVNYSKDNNIKITPISGPSSIINIAMASGLSFDKLSFVGFLPKKKIEIKKIMEGSSNDEVIIFFESPLRIKKTLELLSLEYPNSELCIGREMTKLYEEFLYGKPSELIESDFTEKGEFTIAVKIKKEEKKYNKEEIVELVNKFIKTNMTTKDSINRTSLETGINKNTIYEYYHEK